MNHDAANDRARLRAVGAAACSKPGTTSDVYSINAAGQKAAQGLSGPGSSEQRIRRARVGTRRLAGSGRTRLVADRSRSRRRHRPSRATRWMASRSIARTITHRRRCFRAWGARKCRSTPAACRPAPTRKASPGYVNQVVKTGTYPGYGDASLGVGYPAFYHQASVEAGGSTPDRLFSYYVGLGGSNQNFRFVDNNERLGHPGFVFLPDQRGAGVHLRHLDLHRHEVLERVRLYGRSVAGALHQRPGLRALQSDPSRQHHQSALRHPAPRERCCATTFKPCT